MKQLSSMMRTVLVCASLVVPALPLAARADGPDTDYGTPGPYEGQPEYLNEDGTPVEGATGENLYQPPAEGLCYDEDNAEADCSTDADYASYGQVDDGYDRTAYQDFQGALSPYGTWIDSPQYGQVWYPSTSVVGYDFTPYYSGGRWQLTDYGWTWVSDYDWGWAPFHYGRWVTMANYGWCWVPGRIWGPSWVHWRHGGGYVGWTPMPPRGMRIPPPVGTRVGRWNFVPAPQLGQRHLMRVPPTVVSTVYGRTAPGNMLRSIGSTRVNIGPPAAALALGHMMTTPLRGLSMALPRAQVVVRPGVPLSTRPYLPASFRSQLGGRPGVPAGVGRPGWNPGQAPGRPGWSGQSPVIRPGTPYPAPGWQRPATPNYQAPGWQRPAVQAPTYGRPAYQAPGWQRPAVQAPTYQAPVYQRPTQAPGWQRPAVQAPTYQAPVYQRPTQTPGWQRPAVQAPTYQAPVYQRPAMQAPVYQRPAMQAPVYQRPAVQAPTFQAPVRSAPSFSAPSRPSAPSFSAPSRPSAPSFSAPSRPSSPSAPVHSAPSFRRR